MGHRSASTAAPITLSGGGQGDSLRSILTLAVGGGVYGSRPPSQGLAQAATAAAPGRPPGRGCWFFQRVAAGLARGAPYLPSPVPLHGAHGENPGIQEGWLAVSRPGEVRVIDYAFLKQLEEWVKMQRKVLETFRETKERVEQGDRLDVIVATRAAFQHMLRTLKAFDNWLQDPVIIAHVPKEMLLEVWEVMYRVLEQLLEIDIKHTSDVRELLERLAKEGKLNPLVASVKGGGEEEEFPGGRRPPTMMI